MGRRLILVWALGLIGLIAPASVWGSPPLPWQQTQGPNGGRVAVLATTAAQPGLILAGTPLGVFRSLDDGESWSRLAQDDEASREIWAIAIDPHNARRYYAGGVAGLLLSADGGDTWHAADGNLAWEPIHSIAIHPGSGILYVGSDQGVYRSGDHGEHWEPMREGLPAGAVWSLQIHPANPHVVYVATDRGVFVTGDGGERWYPSSQGLPPQEPVHGILLDPRASQRLFASTGLGAFVSRDAGVTWAPFDATPRQSIDTAHVIDALHGQGAASELALWPLLSEGESPLYPGVTLGGARVLALAAHPTDERLWYAGTARGFYRSTDGGLGWSESNQGLLAAEILALAQWPHRRSRLIAATPWGLLVTEDGGNTWSALEPEVNAAGLELLAIDPCGASAFAASPAGEVFQIDGALKGRPANPVPLSAGATLQHLVVAHEGECVQERPVLWAVDDGGGVWRSVDLGASWAELADGLPDRAPVAAAAWAPDTSFAGAPLLGIGNAVYRLASRNGQPLWERLAIGALDGPVRFILPMPGRPNRLSVLTARGSIYRLIADDGAWRVQGQEALPHGVEPQGLLFAPRGRATALLLAIANDGVLVSDDYGATWALGRNVDLQKAHIRHAVADLDAFGTVYLGSAHGGVYVGAFVRPRPLWPFALLGALGVGALVWRGARYYQLSKLRQEIDALQHDALGWDAVMASTLAAHHRVTPELLQGIPVQAREYAMRRYVEAHRTQALVLSDEPPRIEPARQSSMERFAQNWQALVERLGSLETAAPLAARMAEQLCELLGFAPIMRQTYGAWMGYMVEAASIRLSLPARFPLVFLIRERISPDDMRDLRTLMQGLNALSFFALLVAVSDEGSQREAARGVLNLARAGADDLIVLSASDLYALYMAADPPACLLSKILQQIDLSVVSPYVTSGPVPENMFFGRDYELKVLMRTIRDASYAIVGGRKIGKTSILNKMQRLIDRSSGMSPFYLDCHGVIDHETFFQAIQIATSVGVSSAEPQAMRQLLIRLRRQRNLGNDTIVFLLDEADHLVRYDMQHHGRLFQVLRSLSQEGLCRFVLCGERHLHNALHDPSSPLFNTCRTMRLAYLLPRDVRRIIIEPMQDMGVSFDDRDALVEAVIEMTSCHPNLVQAVCQGLIREINARGDRHIRQDDLARVRRAVGYPDLFLEVVWGNASTLERLITVLMIGRGSFSLAEVRAALDAQECRCSVSEVGRALGNLELTAFYQQQGSRYIPQVRAFDALVVETGLESVLRQSLVEGVLSESGADASLLGDGG